MMRTTTVTDTIMLWNPNLQSHEPKKVWIEGACGSAKVSSIADKNASDVTIHSAQFESGREVPEGILQEHYSEWATLLKQESYLQEQSDIGYDKAQDGELLL